MRMNRFLQYSLEHSRPIRAVYLYNGELFQKTVIVLKVDDEEVSLHIRANRKTLVLSQRDILSCDYARGDHGEGECG